MEINKENKSDLRFEQEDDAVWVFSGDSHQGTEISHLITSHIDDYNEDDVRLICHYAANEIDRLRAKLAKATPEGFVLVPKLSANYLFNKVPELGFKHQDEKDTVLYHLNYMASEFKESAKEFVKKDHEKQIKFLEEEAQEQSHELD